MTKISCLICTLSWLLFFSCQPAADYLTDEATVSKGRALFELQCAGCHNFKSSSLGPNLAGLTGKVSPDWIRQFIQNPVAMIDQGDPRAVKQFEVYKTYMPAYVALPEEDLNALLAYLHTKQELATSASSVDYGPALDKPIPDTISPSNIVLSLRQIATAPMTAEKRPFSRINKMAALPGATNRLFIHDLRGSLYEIQDDQLRSFLHLPDYFPHFIDVPGQGTGLGSFAFHPDYANNGLFYTSHTENPATAAPADFGYADSIQVTVRFVLTEWKQDNPQARTFSGSSRELFRIDMVDRLHGVQEIAFNPLSKAGNADYGKLYICIGDGGSVQNGYAFLVQNKNQPWGNILRIDPQGTNSKNGHYGIPADNPFAHEMSDGVLGEIWAMGFRNPNQICWDTGGDGKMIASGIGHRQIEEINLVEPGRNYGWPEREGTFRLNKYGNLDTVYALPPNDASYDFTYPVAQFDHDEAAAICAGQVYYGKAAPALRGKYLFGGIVNGKIFFVDAAALALGKQADMYELSLQLEDGPITDLKTLTAHRRVDLRFGMDAQGELYIFTKADGKIYQVAKSSRMDVL